ncbi:hypothetical protein SeMB42_g02726 [Synchytrium endobioticum]|uniref:RING-type domain-containing protein n=1 Tax=Synchytrium endobioticum TaxID=286115 RepID=A0A507DCJ5_9FUNG|nr:hypothetical protein SeLEV6574_g07865 [Synchytrium endobioticum]TPX49121.1 hypothetical protein SeMB42_g02726 [Synchytrium endobioticum]
MSDGNADSLFLSGSGHRSSHSCSPPDPPSSDQRHHCPGQLMASSASSASVASTRTKRPPSHILNNHQQHEASTSASASANANASANAVALPVRRSKRLRSSEPTSVSLSSSSSSHTRPKHRILDSDYEDPGSASDSSTFMDLDDDDDDFQPDPPTIRSRKSNPGKPNNATRRKSKSSSSLQLAIDSPEPLPLLGPVPKHVAVRMRKKISSPNAQASSSSTAVQPLARASHPIQPPAASAPSATTNATRSIDRIGTNHSIYNTNVPRNAFETPPLAIRSVTTPPPPPVPRMREIDLPQRPSTVVPFFQDFPFFTVNPNRRLPPIGNNNSNGSFNQLRTPPPPDEDADSLAREIALSMNEAMLRDITRQIRFTSNPDMEARRMYFAAQNQLNVLAATANDAEMARLLAREFQAQPAAVPVPLPVQPPPVQPPSQPLAAPQPHVPQPPAHAGRLFPNAASPVRRLPPRHPGRRGRRGGPTIRHSGPPRPEDLLPVALMDVSDDGDHDHDVILRGSTSNNGAGEVGSCSQERMILMMSSKTIDRIVEVVTKINEGGYECIICWNELQQSNSVIVFGCGHVFCRRCILGYLKSPAVNGCPNCRGTISTTTLIDMRTFSQVYS